MKKTGKYATHGVIEDQYESGSDGKVLKNLLGLKKQSEADRTEALRHFETLEKVVRIYDESHRFTADDICHIHKIWLKSIYAWAGIYRSVNITKGNFTFASADQIPVLMKEFENEYLSKYTPCRYKSIPEIAKALAVVHVELVLIHPFREGNGRLARILSILMALQAGLPALDFGALRGKKKQEYFAAVRAGLDRNYMPMQKVFGAVIAKSLKQFSGKK
jgi:cell filamentation protein